MGDLELAFTRDYEFAPVIVWDALLDADLVSGWLAEAVISPVVGGEYNLRWSGRMGQPESLGRITALQPLERLHVDTTTMGLLRFELLEEPGGSRGTSTRLALTVNLDLERAFAARVTADWMTALDQLDELLHGHPVDWAHWEQGHREAWTRHLDEAAN
ncbi:hypothetical protein BH11ACT5_BH11ACT5_13910 [soil metagenome]